jgi:diaminopimelate decarboxylase
MMTVKEAYPPVGPALLDDFDTAVWPATTQRCDHGDLRIGGIAMSTVAASHGTPAYVIDETDVRQQCRAYTAAFGHRAVAYTAKALLSRAIARWIAEEHLGLYVSSAGELHVAQAAGFPADRIVLYGNAKTPQDLHAAYLGGVGTIVVESLSEIPRLAATAPAGQRLLLRVLTGMEVSDGVDRRFGLRIDTGEAQDAVARIVAQKGLRLVGLDCSIGHQITHVAAYEREVRAVTGFLSTIGAHQGLYPTQLNIGGGQAVAYSGRDRCLATAQFADRIRSVVRVEADNARVPEPDLTVSPGRAIVARAGVTIYHIVSVNRDRDGRRLIAVDGGMSDCPASALCGGQHTATLIGRTPHKPSVLSIVVGRHNDSDDIIIPAMQLPADARPGDLLAVAGTGAYHHSRAMNYQLVGRPPLVAVRGGHTHTLIRRETVNDLDTRDVDDDVPD